MFLRSSANYWSKLDHLITRAESFVVPKKLLEFIRLTGNTIHDPVGIKLPK